MFLYPLLGFTYSNILTCLYIYIFKTHIHPYVQIVNIIFTYSRSHCCECAGADGPFWIQLLDWKTFWVESLWNTLSFPKAEEVLLCVLLTFSERAGSNKVSAAASSSLEVCRVLPEVFPPPYCFQYCCRVSCGRRHPGEQRRSNWEALTEFNKGEGLNRRSRLLASLVSVHRRGQKRSWGPRWMMIGVAMVCGW